MACTLIASVGGSKKALDCSITSWGGLVILSQMTKISPIKKRRLKRSAHQTVVSPMVDLVTALSHTMCMKGHLNKDQLIKDGEPTCRMKKKSSRRRARRAMNLQQELSITGIFQNKSEQSLTNDKCLKEVAGAV